LFSNNNNKNVNVRKDWNFLFCMFIKNLENILSKFYRNCYISYTFEIESEISPRCRIAIRVIRCIYLKLANMKLHTFLKIN